MQEQDNIQEELRHLSPLLAKLKKEQQADIPFNYFEGLSDEILNKIQTTEKKTGWNILEEWITKLLEPRVILALSSIILLLVAAVFLTHTASTPTQLAELSSDEISLYISEHIDDFEDELYEVLPSDLELSLDKLEDIDMPQIDDLMDSIIDDLDESSLEDFYKK